MTHRVCLKSRHWCSVIGHRSFVIDEIMDPIELPIEDSLDLHTFQPREVRSVVEEYLHQARLRGFSVVRIIHGRGIGVQREIVRSALKQHAGVLSFHDSPDRGSTEVILCGPKPADPNS